MKFEEIIDGRELGGEGRPFPLETMPAETLDYVVQTRGTDGNPSTTVFFGRDIISVVRALNTDVATENKYGFSIAGGKFTGTMPPPFQLVNDKMTRALRGQKLIRATMYPVGFVLEFEQAAMMFTVDNVAVVSLIDGSRDTASQC